VNPVTLEPPAVAQRPQAPSPELAAAGVFQRRVKWVDRLARTLISVSGMTIIAAVLGIGVFLVLEVAPLLRGARVSPAASMPAVEPPAYLVRVDEHQELALVVGAEPVVRVLRLADGTAGDAVLLGELDGQRVTSAASIIGEPRVAVATDRGAVWIGQLAFQTSFEGGRRQNAPVIETEWVVEVAPGYAVRQLAWRPAAQGAVIAAATDGGVIVARVVERRPLVGQPTREVSAVAVPVAGAVTQLLLEERGRQLIVGTTEGAIARWELGADGPSPIESVQVVPGGAVTALAYLLGDRSIAVGGVDGSVATWSLVRSESTSDGWRLTRLHTFAADRAPIAAIAPSPRDKGFITVAEDGAARLHYMTSERTLARFAAGAQVRAAAMAPKTNGAVLVDGAGVLRHWHIDNPHPEVSWRALFGTVWYEGYPQPDHIWQSTGGTDDFESKFSLIPLAFGTLKGTVYALLFAVPLAIGGALYCSQFLDKQLRNSVKSTIELMAALPSVVLGFIAGLVLAPMVQEQIVAVLAAPVLIAVIVPMGMVACQYLPGPRAQVAVRRGEFWLLVGWVIIGVVLAGALAPVIERTLFGGDFETWLMQTMGIRYDQRNSLVVGWAMGFAVIPLIFTICEDAFSAVPRHLTGASLACGASLWQTAWRVVLPAAGSGVFSAVMVGFGRAIGETMIVLMATGNTPVMDWSMFNGFRALSANIAVEIPEAPYGGTLYRVLFVAALLLFSMTFVVNTAAELIRLRLRARLKGL
jgi:phosphate transport system permease protein